MNKNIRTIMKAVCGVALLLISISADAQNRDFNSFDADRDSGINEDEFSKMYSSSYNDYDIDRNGRITDQEFYDYSFNRLDINRNDALDATEWQNGYDNLYSNYLNSPEYSSYDIDGNQQISRREYYESLNTSRFYSDYDTDGDNSISTDELRTRMFRDLDGDQDGLINENEFDAKRAMYFKN